MQKLSVRNIVGPGEVRAAAGDEAQRGAADADQLVGLELHGRQHRRRAQTDDVGLAAVLQVEAALLLVVGDEGVLLARDRLIAEVEADALAGIAADRVHAGIDGPEIAAALPLDDHHPAGDRVGLEALGADVAGLGLAPTLAEANRWRDRALHALHRPLRRRVIALEARAADDGAGRRRSAPALRIAPRRRHDVGVRLGRAGL